MAEKPTFPPPREALPTDRQAGPQDPLAPLEPPTPPVVVVPGQAILDINNRAIATETCAGAGAEELDHQHRSPAAIAVHLEIFLRHHSAWKILAEYGADLCNAVLRELPHTSGIYSPAGFFNTRVKALAAGTPPMTPPAAAGGRSNRQRAQRDKYNEDYERRWGHGE